MTATAIRDAQRTKALSQDVDAALLPRGGGWLGAEFGSEDKDEADGKLLDTGELVGQVESGSAAEKAGLQPGDGILAVNGTRVDTNYPRMNVLMTFKPGATVTLDVVRNGQALSLQATHDTRPASTPIVVP